MINSLAIENYRSLLRLIVPLGRINVITGPNGSGKSNLYRALRLLAETAQGGVVNALAREGGLNSTFWSIATDRWSRSAPAGGGSWPPSISTIQLDKELGQTRIIDRDLQDEPLWHWPD